MPFAGVAKPLFASPAAKPHPARRTESPLRPRCGKHGAWHKRLMFSAYGPANDIDK
jgi:hypothetical protein